MLFETFSPWGFRFSFLVRFKPHGEFNFQLFFVTFTMEFQKIVLFYLQTVTRAQTKQYECRIKYIVRAENIVFREGIKLCLNFKTVKLAFCC